MRFTRYTDYSVRVLIHLALREERLCQISEISETYDISRHHLMKVVSALARDGFVETIRGRSGGIRLAQPADQIVVGAVIRRTEEGFELAECSGCLLSPVCGLTDVFARGVQAMLDVFDQYTIADLITNRAAMQRLIGGGVFPVLRKHCDQDPD